MGWEVYTKPLEDGESLTPAHIEELWLALDERVRAIRDSGSGMILSSLPSEYTTRRIHADHRVLAGSPQETTNVMGDFVRITSGVGLASGAQGQGYAREIGSTGTFAAYKESGEDSVLRVAASDLGYSTADAISLVSDITFASFSLRSIHEANVIRKAIQLMDKPIVPLYTSTARETNRLFFSNQNLLTIYNQDPASPPSWEDAVQEFAAKDPTGTLSTDAASIHASNPIGNSFRIESREIFFPLKLSSIWEKGYKLYAQFITDGPSEEWQDTDFLFGLDSLSLDSMELTETGEQYVVEVADQSEASSPITDDILVLKFDRQSIESWEPPVTFPIENRFVEIRRRTTGQNFWPFLFGEINFEYGPDPD